MLQDPNLSHTLQFGIGMHHAGLTDSDRVTCERLFVAGKIQVTRGSPAAGLELLFAALAVDLHCLAGLRQSTHQQAA